MGLGGEMWSAALVRNPLPFTSWAVLSVLVAGFAGSCRTLPGATGLEAGDPAPASAVEGDEERSPSSDHPESGRPPLGFDGLEEHSLYLVMVDRFHDGDGAAFPGRDPADPLAFHGGDLKGLLEKLPYLSDLGVTALWLTPVHLQVSEPVGPAGQRHWPLHGYWPEDHVQLDPRFGTDEDLRAITERAHELGLRVVLDVVVNHFGYGAKAAQLRALVRSQQLGTCPGGDATEWTACLFGLPDLKTEDRDVRSRVAAWTITWVERFRLDGFRIDAAKHVEPELLWEVHDGAERLTRARGGRGFLTLAEHWGAAPGDDVVGAYVESGAADTLFDFSFSGLVEGFLTGRMRAEALAHHLERWHAAEGPPLVHFLDTHDTATLHHRLGAARQRYPLAAVLQMTVRGIPLVTWGDEVARGGGEWPRNRSSMPWERLNDRDGRRLHATWRQLLHSRRALPSLRSREYRTALAVTGEDAATLAFQRGEDTLVVVHRGAAATRTVASLPPGASVDVCAGVGFSPKNGLVVDDQGALELRLPADSAVILSLVSGRCAENATPPPQSAL